MRPASACPVCSGDALRVLLEASELEAERRWLRRFIARRSLGEPGGEEEPEPAVELQAGRLLSCRRCGTVLRDAAPGGAAGLSTSGDVGRRWELLESPGPTRIERLLARAPRIARHLPPRPAVLEVGCAPRGLLRAARGIGRGAAEMETPRDASTFGEATGLERRQSWAGGLGATAGTWDGVFSCDASLLSHPGSLLERAATWLRPGGVLVLRIPNGKFELACLHLRRTWRGARRATRVLCAQAHNGFLGFPHARGYTPTSIRSVLAAHGFATEAILGDTALEPPCADPTGFATREAARYRRAILRCCRVIETDTGCLYHPWLDVIARKSARAALWHGDEGETASASETRLREVVGELAGDAARAKPGNLLAE